MDSSDVNNDSCDSSSYIWVCIKSYMQPITEWYASHLQESTYQIRFTPISSKIAKTDNNNITWYFSASVLLMVQKLLAV